MRLLQILYPTIISEAIIYLFHAEYFECYINCYLYLFNYKFSVVLHLLDFLLLPGEMDDVLDSVCLVYICRNFRRSFCGVVS